MKITKKRKKQMFIAGGIILAIVLISIFSSGFKFPFAIGSGFSSLSLGQQDFISNDPMINGKAWLLTVSQNGAGQSASGSFTASDTDGTSSNPFTVNLLLNENYATYQIFSQGTYVKTVDYIKSTYNPFSATGGCNSAVWSNWYHPSQLAIVGDVYCYNYINRGIYGTLGDANVNFKSTISVEGTGGTDSCSISNVGSSSCWSSKNNVYASWVGSLVSGQSAPSPSGQGIVAFYDTSTGGWKTASKTTYDAWKSYDNGGFTACLGTVSASSITNCFDNYNGRASAFLTGYAFKTTGGVVATTSGTQSSGQVKIDLPTQIQFPVITMRIKAAFLGINIPVGEPEIESASSLTFQTGQTGNIAVEVSNVGDGAGSFDVYATCSEGFSQTGNALRISSLSPGASQTVYIPITSNIVGTTKEGTCSLTAKDINNPSNFDTYSVAVSSSAITICSEGQVAILGNKIQQCQQNRWVTTKECIANQTAKYVNGVPDCVDNSAIEEGFFSKIINSIGSFFGNIFNGIFDFFTLLKIAVVIAVGIFSLLFSKDLFSNFKAVEDKNWLAWILAGIIALLLSALVFSLFWIGIFVFVIFLVIKFFVLRR